MAKAARWIIPCVLLAVGLAVWGPSVRYGFVWDDQFFIQNNASVRNLSQALKHFYDPSTAASPDMASQFLLFRPLRNLSWMADYQLAGLHPGWWHLHNVLLHILNAWLVGVLAWMLVKRRDAQIVASLFFLLHPVVSEAVCWVKCRDDLLSTAFVLLASILWVRWRPEPFTRFRGAALALAALAACLAKEQAVVLPALLAALDLGAGRMRRVEAGDLFRRLAVPALAVVVFLAWRWAVLGRASQCDWFGGSALRTWLTMVPAFAEYVRLALVPWPLLADYAGFLSVTGWSDPHFVGGALVLAAAAAAAALAAGRVPESRAGLAWAVLALVPVSNIVPMMQYLAERFLYLPLVGGALAAGVLFGRSVRLARTVSILGIAALLAWYCWLDVQRRGVWSDEVSLFSATVRDSPATLRPRRNLANALARDGRHAEALPLTRENWLMSRDRWGEPAGKRMEDAVNYASALMANGREEEGRAFLERLLLEDPEAGWPRMYLGVYQARRGNNAAALALFEEARRRLPSEPEVLDNLGMALRDAGRHAEAERVFREAVSMPGAGRGPYLNLAATLWKRGDIRGAARVYRSMLERWPGDPEAAHWLRQAERAP